MSWCAIEWTGNNMDVDWSTEFIENGTGYDESWGLFGTWILCHCLSPTWVQRRFSLTRYVMSPNLLDAWFPNLNHLMQRHLSTSYVLWILWVYLGCVGKIWCQINLKGIISTKSIVWNVKTESRSRRRPLKMIGCGTLRPLLCGVLDLDRSYLETRLEVKWASDCWSIILTHLSY